MGAEPMTTKANKARFPAYPSRESVQPDWANEVGIVERRTIKGRTYGRSSSGEFFAIFLRGQFSQGEPRWQEALRRCKAGAEHSRVSRIFAMPKSPLDV